ncbi:hypothetical protein B0H12DRAFT_1161998, partial [Mycena haematopus]
MDMRTHRLHRKLRAAALLAVLTLTVEKQPNSSREQPAYKLHLPSSPSVELARENGPDAASRIDIDTHTHCEHLPRVCSICNTYARIRTHIRVGTPPRAPQARSIPPVSFSLFRRQGRARSNPHSLVRARAIYRVCCLCLGIFLVTALAFSSQCDLL